MRSGYYEFDKRFIVYYDAAKNKIYDFGEKIAHWIDDLAALTPISVMDGDTWVHMLNQDPYYDLGLRISSSLGEKI